MACQLARKRNKRDFQSCREFEWGWVDCKEESETGRSRKKERKKNTSSKERKKERKKRNKSSKKE